MFQLEIPVLPTLGVGQNGENKKLRSLQTCSNFFQRELYKLGSTYKELNSPVITHLKKCFNYALDQNRDNSEDAKKALLNIVNHVYDEHNSCGDWCNAKDNPDYIYKNLPRGEPLQNSNLKVALTKCLEKFTHRIARIARGGSSQPNESFNRMVAIKYPKSRHYAESNSYKYRTMAAVCQKNIGATYMTQVFQVAGLEVGYFTHKHSSSRDIIRQKLAQRQNTVSYKRKRCRKKLKKQRKTFHQERKEGISYRSGIFNVSVDEDNAEDENYTADSPLVLIDIESTSFYETADILQIAAKCGTQKFVKYMFSLQRIDDKASETNGFTIIEGHLWQNGTIVTTTPPLTVAEEFLQFLEACGPKAFLVGHNVIKFDAPRIIRWLINLNLFARFKEIVYGFIDSIPLISQGKIKKLEELARTY
ncbi:uncharacterized protein LOC130673844 [Microplitis mediator]|uniref:uncharacterized protein LOC130673844 n=1 Tax=Microplitis mediator TaxID=375433 RepID=UPI002553A357|nr:uncharacterized protein LOC130673844 [Microplitis mediator]